PRDLGEPLGKGVVDSVLHQDAVGADAGLPGIAVFRGDRALDRHLDIGVVEDDERGVAAEFERDLLDRAGALLISSLPISVEPVKVSLRTIGLEVISPPISPALPVTQENTPFGTPARSASSHSASAE